VTAEWRGSGRVDLAGLLFNPGARRRALALHGWLDNAMSFAGLAAELPDWELLALDFAGHGESAHLPEGGWYHFIDYLDDVVTALQDRPIDLLIGHSLGGAVATAWAAARPATVPRLALIEALGPLAGAPNTAVSALRQGLSERRAIAAKQLRRFSDPQQAIVARLSANRMQQASAAALIRRGLRRAGEGWVGQRPTADGRLPVAPVRDRHSALDRRSRGPHPGHRCRPRPGLLPPRRARIAPVPAARRSSGRAARPSPSAYG
jgi:pimeloyl-ACP methyl ester carboxylesterase